MTIGIDRLRADVAEVLAEDLDAIGAEDDLLELGIDSVRLMMLTQRWQDAGIDVDLVDLAERPTLAGWAEVLGAAASFPAPPTVPAAGPLDTAVVRVEQVTPRTLRITLADGGDGRFAGARAGDHVVVSTEGLPPRALTVRHHAASGELDLDVLTDRADPLARWAATAAPGAAVRVDGPHAGPELPAPDGDWTLLVADAVAFPALAARLESLRAGTRVLAVVAVADTAEEQLVPTAADAEVTWVHGAHADVARAVLAVLPEAGRGRAWVAGDEGLVSAVDAALATVPALDGRRVSEPYPGGGRS